MAEKLLGVLVLLIFLGVSQTAQARNYAIELIVFEQAQRQVNTEGQIVEGEKWDFSDRRIAKSLQRMVALEARSDAFETDKTLSLLEPARRELIAAGHRILRTAKWFQKSAVYQHAPLVSLGQADTSLPYGFVRVYRTSLIYADIDLQFSPSDPAVNTLPIAVINDLQADDNTELPADNLPQHYFLSEKRRLKFEEVHYFDHPKVGAILGIWPLATN